MPGYAENVGIASFLQDLSRNLMTQSTEEQRRRDEENKWAAEQAQKAIERGELVKSSPMNAPTYGQPLGIGSFSDSGGMSGIRALDTRPAITIDRSTPGALPAMPEYSGAQQFSAPGPATLEQQREYHRAISQGLPAPEGYSTVQRTMPDKSHLMSQTVSDTGGITSTYEGEQAIKEKEAKNALRLKEIQARGERVAKASLSRSPEVRAIGIKLNELYNKSYLIDEVADPEGKRSLDADIAAYTHALDQVIEGKQVSGLIERGTPKPNPSPVTPPAKRKWNPVK